MSENNNEEFISYVRTSSYERLIGYLNSMSSGLISQYPQAEVESWTIQKDEASRILTAEVPNVSQAPFIAAVCQAQFGDAEPEVRLAQTLYKAQAIKANADAWATVAAFINGLRARVQLIFESAETQDAILEALHNAISEAEMFRSAAGI